MPRFAAGHMPNIRLAPCVRRLRAVLLPRPLEANERESDE
jgi:hypothetical protein